MFLVLFSSNQLGLQAVEAIFTLGTQVIFMKRHFDSWLKTLLRLPKVPPSGLWLPDPAPLWSLADTISAGVPFPQEVGSHCSLPLSCKLLLYLQGL